MELTNRHILIVDDVLMNLQITAQILKEAGFRFSLAQDGLSAIKTLEQEIPDLILLDIMMPGMDGLEVCRTIKKNEKWEDIPIIFLTAMNQNDNLIDGFKAGGLDYITKPFNRDELLIRIKTHLELSLSRKKIIEMNKTRAKLYSIIAHDIRSPLFNISLTINAISSGLLKPGSADFMSIIKDLDTTTKGTTILLNNLLEWAKIQSDIITLTPKPLNIGFIVNDCIQLLKANANNKSILLTTKVSEDSEAFVDEVSIHTVFRNLISNAIKFTPNGGSVNLTVQKTENFIIVIIKDTGIGISPEIITKIFNNNEYHSSLGTNNEQGSGLGLYMVKDFVNRNNGKIDVKSSIGMGTEISILLPTNNVYEDH